MSLLIKKKKKKKRDPFRLDYLYGSPDKLTSEV